MAYVPAFARDARHEPTYGLAQAAPYLGLSETTLRQWVMGRPYPVQTGSEFSPPLIKLPDPDRPMLSFTNLVEAYVLASLRRKHRIKMQKIRQALSILIERFSAGESMADLAEDYDLTMPQIEEAARYGLPDELAG